MNSLSKFVLAVVMAVGGMAGVAVATPPAQSIAKAASGAKYFTTLTQAKNYAKLMRAKGYFTAIYETEGGQYMVEYWSGH